MDNKNQEQKISNLEFNQANFLNDYKFLVQKLKSIKENIYLLEKSFLEKDK